MSKGEPMADEKQQPDTTKKQSRSLGFRRSPDYIAYYASNIRMTISFFDIRMISGEVIVDENNLIFNDRVSIVLSPQHAKVFLKVLQDNIEGYEKQFGPIPERPESETTVDADTTEDVA